MSTTEGDLGGILDNRKNAEEWQETTLFLDKQPFAPNPHSRAEHTQRLTVACLEFDGFNGGFGFGFT